MNKKNVILTFSLLTVLLLSLAASTYAYQGESNLNNNRKGKSKFSLEKHTALKEAIGNNDFQAWKALVGDDNRISEIINEDNFAQFVEAHKLMEEGKFEEAKEIKEALGMPNMGKKHQRKEMNKEFKVAIQESLDNADYNAWKELMKDHPQMLEAINETNFSKLAEAHSLMMEGKVEEAKEIRDELGLPKLGKRQDKRCNRTSIKKDLREQMRNFNFNQIEE